MTNFTDNDFLLIFKYINGEEVEHDVFEDLKKKLEYNVKLIELRSEFMNRAEELDKEYLKKEEDK